MSNRRTQTSNGEAALREIGPWRVLATVSALLAVLWIGAGCADESTSDDALPPALSTAIPEPTTGSVLPTESPEISRNVMPTAVGSPPVTASANQADDVRKVMAMPAPARDGAMTAGDFPTPPDRDLLELARQMRWRGQEPDATETPQPQDWQVGQAKEFWTLDYPRRTMVSNEFRLLAISDSAYWWSDAVDDVADDGLARTVKSAEEQVFPGVEAVFASGQEPERIHVINGRIPGVGGYVSGSDQYPMSVAPYSNEVPAIYINTRAAAYGDDRLLSILAHELQHVIHQIADESEATWLNEGLAELAVTESGFQAGSMYGYLRRPNVSLVNWPDDLSSNVGLNYGAASLFAHYIRQHYAPTGGLQDLLAIDSDGIAAVDEFLTSRGAEGTAQVAANFHSVFADWMVANLLDEDSGRHGYEGLDIQASITERQDAAAEGPHGTLDQYGIDYVHIRDINDGVTVHFEGVGTAALLPTEVDGDCWWSNRGDTISATLTRRMKVPEAAPDGLEPMLTYRYWHDIEEEWDYLYVSASLDGGKTWEVLQATGTTDANPVGNSYGYGYTGDSGGWKDGKASLDPYAGRDALVRFHYVTDDAINGPGMCIGDIEISGDADLTDAEDWIPDGFVLVNNRVRQDWIVWVIVEGSEPLALRMDLTRNPAEDLLIGSVPLEGMSDRRVVVAVAPVAPATMQPGVYRVWVEAAQ